MLTLFLIALLFFIFLAGLFLSFSSRITDRRVIFVDLGDLGKIDFDKRWDIDEPFPARPSQVAEDAPRNMLAEPQVSDRSRVA